MIRTLPLAPLRRGAPVLPALALLLAVHFAIWAWVGTMARSNLDMPGDMVEAFVWGDAWQHGYFKHPPLSAWVAGAWFVVLPRTDASFAAMVAVYSTLALAGFALLCREFLDRRWSLACVAAAALTPGLTTAALRFNANSVLIVPWAFGAAFAVRAMKRGRDVDAAAAGLFLGLAMLGKYYAGVLLASLLLAALVYAPARARLWSRTGLVTLLVFAAVVLQHGAWLLDNDLLPIAYAREATGQIVGSPWLRALHFSASMLVFPVLGYLLLWIAARRPGGGAVLHALRDSARDPQERAVWLFALGPVLLTAMAAVITGTRVATVWGLPLGMGLVLLSACAMRRTAPRPELAPARRWLVACWAVAVAAGPLAGLASTLLETRSAAEPRAEVAAAATALFRERTGSELQWIGGTPALAASAAFYGKDRLRYWSLLDARRETPWIDMARVLRDGTAVLCLPDDLRCLGAAEARGGEMLRLDLSKTAWGIRLSPRTVNLLIVPPADHFTP